MYRVLIERLCGWPTVVVSTIRSEMPKLTAPSSSLGELIML